MTLPSFAADIHLKLAENMHELWAMHKIETGWEWGEQRDEVAKTHPCIAPYSDIPEVATRFFYGSNKPLFLKHS